MTNSSQASTDLIDLLADALRILPPRDQLALRRFYCDACTEMQVCADLGLDVARFRELRAALRSHWKDLVARSQQAQKSGESS